jgi:alanine racemase
LPAIIQFDTGMNRLGLGPDETRRLIDHTDLLEGVDVIMIMSHFLAADEAGDPHTPAQAARFAEIARHFPRALKSLSNSAGIFRDQDYHYDVVRPGMALYGLNPVPHESNPMQPVVSLHVPVLQTRLVKKGDVVGYSATYTFTQDTPMATVAMGYADGFLRSLSNKASLFWKGYPCPVRGRVSMDLVTVSLENIPEGQCPHDGDMLEVIGPHQSADALAACAGTIGYEILTSLGQRYRRVYI